MNDELKKAGLTMIEILIAVALIALLAGGMFFVSGRAREQAKIELTKSTLAMLDTALEQYYDYGKTYPPDVEYAGPGTPPTRSLSYAFDPTGGAVLLSMNPSNPAYELDYVDAQSVEVLYYYLNRVPQSRAILSKLHDAAISAKAVKLDANNKPLASKPTDPTLVITITGVGDVGLFRVVDTWNMPLRYIRYRDPANLTVENTNFPLLRSAGPDRVFGTADDIVNRKN